MKKFLIVLALIVGGASLPANANPTPYPLAGKWETTLTAGDLATFNYEPRLNLLLEFELLPSGAYAFNVYAYGIDGKRHMVTSQDIEPGTPPPPNMLLRTSVTDSLGTVTLVDYELNFDFASRTVRGRYAKRLFFARNNFPLHLFGWVHGRRTTPEQTTLPAPLPKAPSFYEEEKREIEHDKCHRCVSARSEACMRSEDTNITSGERKRLKKICNGKCDCNHSCLP